MRVGTLFALQKACQEKFRNENFSVDILAAFCYIITMKTIGNIGSALMIVASFNMGNGILGFLLAIAGLLILTIQAIDLKANNLIILNLVSVVGFLISIIKVL